MTEVPDRKPGQAAAWALTLLLTLCYVLSVVDRNIMSFVVIDMQRDLGVSDLQIGMVQGFAFSIFYAVAGLPIGWAIDRFERRRLLSAAIFGWSCMTIFCGMAQNFAMLAASRVGVGIGEAALTPGSYSIFSDAFPKRQFALASAIYSLGPSLAAVGAAALAGIVLGSASSDGTVILPWFGAIQGWRAVFICAGAPGLVMALALLRMREPPRARHASPAANQRIWSFALENWRTHLIFSAVVMLSVLVGTSFSAWVPAALERSLGWSKVEISAAVGAIGLASGLGASASGGLISYWILARERMILLLLIALGGTIVTAICGGALLLVADASLFVLLTAANSFIFALMLMISPTFLQLITPPHLRGQMTALFLLVNIGIGMGSGPVLVGYFSDYVFSDGNLVKALGLVGLLASALASIGYVYLLRTMPRYLAAVEQGWP